MFPVKEVLVYHIVAGQACYGAEVSPGRGFVLWKETLDADLLHFFPLERHHRAVDLILFIEKKS